MMGKKRPNNKAAAGKFEREMCSLLSKWWSAGKDDNVFYRTEGSGNRATVRAAAGKDVAFRSGDVGCVHPDGLPFLKVFAVELKKGYNKFTVQDILDKQEYGAEQVYEGWLAQAQEAMKSSGSMSWLIVARRKNRRPIAVLPSMALSWLGVSNVPKPHILLYLQDGSSCVTAMPLDSFTDRVRPAMVRALAERKPG